ncbi:lactate racemase domain-containing protein [Pararhodobacter sp. SW119]|uniref:lactate racemase domain-containing protein n=1 Tax=Pararhodobacter sp. SW119 TaxID=2780075 RepID=UPI001ADF7A43|nr:lactate racemase domain-containing protein [Pararhodobacter sp. SW119]
MADTLPNYVRLVADTPLPRIALCRQRFDAARIDDPAAAVADAMGAPCVAERVKPGMRIAVTAGSRGLASFPELLTAIIRELQARGAQPFVVPSMGSHGGATAEGQRAVLAKLGVTEDVIGCPIESSMETVEVGRLENGMSVQMDRLAQEADGIVLFNRIKPHTSFRAPLESGVAKMLAIGLGKQSGAEACHSRGIDRVGEFVALMARMKLERCKVLFAIGTIENAYDQLSRVVVLDRDGMMDAEVPLLREAMANMPRLPLGDPAAPLANGPLDVLVVDEIGKEFSGTGMDPNITGRFSSPRMTGGPEISRLAVLGLSERTAGNGNGAARADVVTQRLADAFDREPVYANALTSTVLTQAALPMVMPDDRTAIQTVVRTCLAEDPARPRLLRIANTLQLEWLYASEAMLPELAARPGIEVVGELEELRFEGGRLVNPWPGHDA